MRDTLRDQDYWEKLIQKRSAKVLRWVTEVESGSLPPNQHVGSARVALVHLFELIPCRYSAGLDGFGELVKTVARMIDISWDGSDFPRDHKGVVYHEYVQPTFDQVLWCLSLTHLLDLDDEVFETLAKVIDRDGVTDVVLEFLLSCRLKDRPLVKADSYQFALNPLLYKRLREAILEPDPTLAAEALKVYVRRDWYRAHSSAGWHNTHKRTDTDYYTGYWCWEAAAVVKLRGLDDSGFRDWKYYPKDMLTGLE